MDALRNLISRGHAAESGAMLAAAVLDQTNQVLAREYGLEPDLARATRYHHNEVVIETTHGAVTGRLTSEIRPLLHHIQTKLRELFPRQRIQVTRITVRTI